eukprot:GHVT01047986.1.p2 GENE.GHVT01047986.1~~GHVT01047986.1.p2  ORF type:complete len:134 (-),score=27.22 GHVT01047986.1:397-798(-)
MLEQFRSQVQEHQQRVVQEFKSSVTAWRLSLEGAGSSGGAAAVASSSGSLASSLSSARAHTPPHVQQPPTPRERASLSQAFSAATPAVICPPGTSTPSVRHASERQRWAPAVLGGGDQTEERSTSRKRRKRTV